MKQLTVAGMLCAVFLTASMASCGRNSIPKTEDVPDIIAEARGTKPISKWQDSEARRAVRSAFRTMLYFDSVHEAEVARRFRTPELRNYLMLSDSYIGGDFPRRTAALLREVQQANRQYLQLVETFPTVLNERLAPADVAADQQDALVAALSAVYAERQRPVVHAVAALDTFVQATAQLYELAASHSGSFQSMRTGLEISDGTVHQRFNRLVDVANHAHVVADTAIRRLDPEEQARFRRMGVASPVRR